MSKSLESYSELIEPLWSKVDISSTEMNFATSIRDIPRPMLLLFASNYCLSEIWNGGILQFLWNSTGMLAPEAIEGFEALGMPRLALILQRAIEPLGAPYPREREARWSALLAASDKSESELATIFSENKTFYMAYVKATESLSLSSLTETVYELAESENNGFQASAMSYAQSIVNSSH